MPRHGDWFVDGFGRTHDLGVAREQCQKPRNRLGPELRRTVLQEEIIAFEIGPEPTFAIQVQLEGQIVLIRGRRVSRRSVHFATLRAWFASSSKRLAARRLNTSPKTVEIYLDRVRTKYAAVGRSASTKSPLVVRALEDGLITLDELENSAGG